LATPRRALLVLVLLHLPMIGFLVGVTGTGLGVYPHDPHLVPDAIAAAVIGALQLVLSLRVALHRGRRATNVLLYLAVLAVAVAPETWDVDTRWFTATWFAAASGGLVVPGRWRIVAFAAPILAGVIRNVQSAGDVSAATMAYSVAYEAMIMTLGAAALVVSVRVVQVVRDLSASRAELGELVSRAERQRAGRDLHDTLGQRLSAVSIKGDLALALLPTQPDAAAREVREIATIARDAVDELDAVAQDRQRPSLADELARSVGLLRTAGVETELRQASAIGAPDIDTIFGWAVREATTNLLAHSDATWCRIEVAERNGAARLEVVNDGAGRSSGRLGGLAGLAERVRRIDGTVEAGRVGLDGFRLRVAIPTEGRE
jgi:two-component system sensor histidine kinase DesK